MFARKYYKASYSGIPPLELLYFRQVNLLENHLLAKISGNTGKGYTPLGRHYIYMFFIIDYLKKIIKYMQSLSQVINMYMFTFMTIF